MNQENLKKTILEGEIFIYPTDTIYGIGCNALDKKAVEKIRKIKQRDKKPFSIIAPSFKWIEKHCFADVDLKKYLPGPFTIILKKQDKGFLNWVSNTDSLGIRIPDDKFCKKVQETGVPFITTSINLTGEKPINNIKKIPKKILEKVDVIIKGKNLSGKPSTLIINGKEVKRQSYNQNI